MGDKPDENDVWKLVSDIPLEWNAKRPYDGNSFVNHKESQYYANYYAGIGDEPGKADMWKKVGPRSCVKGK